ncbi:type IV secretory system conjugative DNA transfer family protein [Embleya sp. NPDC001921]
MSATHRGRGPSVYDPFLFFAVVVGGFVSICAWLWLAAGVGARLHGGHEPPSPSPATFALEWITGDYSWPGAWATAAAVILLAVLGGFAFAIWYAFHGREVHKIDRAARYLAPRRELRGTTTRGARAAARRMGVRRAAGPGLRVGRTVRGGRDLWGSWEDMHVDIWGPRTGKTATRAIPAVVSAPGTVVVTSNKRDILDATRSVRARRGPVWVFDPQGQAGEPATWWWNPLTFIGDNVVKAITLASIFASINRARHTRSDGYFEPAGQDLFGHLMLAASVDKRPITDVYTWLTRATDDTPARILRRNGHHLAADAVEGVLTAPSRQRAGVYGTALQMASFLSAPQVTQWVTPGGDPARREFSHARFASVVGGTIYLLSEETNKMAAPLVLALTTAIAYASEGAAIESPGGRLATPTVFVLDEAANVCPWQELPTMYSHYGSRGILMMTLLQSWAQGAAVWGEVGMAKLWGAANVRVYGGGVSDTRFLAELSSATGVFEPRTTSTTRRSSAWWPDSVGRSSRSEPVLDVADLASMPRGRALVLMSGRRPVLVEPLPWWRGPHAEAVRASIAAHSPAAATNPWIGGASARPGAPTRSGTGGSAARTRTNSTPRPPRIGPRRPRAGNVVR